MAQIEYTALNLPKTPVEELKVRSTPFYTAYGRTYSYRILLQIMIDSFSKTHQTQPMGSIALSI